MPESNVGNRADSGMTAEANGPTSEQVALALQRILGSNRFVRSKRLSRFLRFAVEHALQGKAGELKEYTIATAVYGRKDDFDPTLDTIVRSEARRLRRKLKEYYDAEGRDDSIIIVFGRGSYTPAHRLRLVPPEASSSSEEEVSVAVEPFECDGSDPLTETCAFGISDEILHRLTYLVGIRVICGSVRRFGANGVLPKETLDVPRAGVVLRGTVRAYGNLLRVTTRATTESRLLWSHQVDSRVGDTTLIHLQERAAIDIVSRFEQWRSGRLISTAATFGHADLDVTDSPTGIFLGPQ